MFADGAYRTVDDRHPLGALVMRAGVDWSKEVRELDEIGLDPSHPFYWGVFKLSGLTGDPVLALKNAAT